jgi:hypothetical protein
MNDKNRAKKTRPCPAYRDKAFVTVNILIWLLGAFGMYWMTVKPILNLVLPVAYLVVNVGFFWHIFSRVVCPHCAYHYPDLPREQYFSTHKSRFVQVLRFWYKVWFLIGWVWPVTTIFLGYLISKRPILLFSLIGFFFVAFGVFFPVLRLRVCSNCKANELGICPFFPPKPVEARQ